MNALVSTNPSIMQLLISTKKWKVLCEPWIIIQQIVKL
jgi:hypothetical protein